MPTAWYVVPYVIDSHVKNVRFPDMYPINDQIHSEGGEWVASEILGNRCIVKVRASQGILAQLNRLHTRMPKDRLDDSLNDLPQVAKTRLVNLLLDMGYRLPEIRDKLGNDPGSKTLRDVLNFMSTRKFRPKYHPDTKTITLDGEQVKPKDIDVVDRELLD